MGMGRGISETCPSTMLPATNIARPPLKVTLLGIVSLSILVGCGQRPKASTVSTPKETIVRTDLGPITRRLPKLGPLQSVWWQSVGITANSFPSPPVHPAYRVLGIAQLESTRAQEFSRAYKWHKMPATWKPEITLTNVSLRLTNWYRSSNFTRDCKPTQLPGHLFFDPSSGVVYFDIEVE
jgi:hypothetical protein